MANCKFAGLQFELGLGLGRHLTFTVPFSIQVYNWVSANLMLGVTLQWTSIPYGGE